MTNDEDINLSLQSLIKVSKEIAEIQANLLKYPETELPPDWDAVVMSEICEALAGDIYGAETQAAFLGSFWETHHLLAEHMPYEKAVWVFFSHVEEMLNRAIEYRTPNA
jgi:hypothetical protein